MIIVVGQFIGQLLHYCDMTVCDGAGVFFIGLGFPLWPKTSLHLKNIQLFLFSSCICFGHLMTCLSHWRACVTPGCVDSARSSVYFVWKCFWTETTLPELTQGRVWKVDLRSKSFAVRVYVCVCVLSDMSRVKSVLLYL